ncbi:hypothetical protein I553_9738 [Mycobacterium xenopi 4042]|uniref:Uncharacterized protein n=1 Tax=Mycobacterium xenopi 4042 TaxID=1299334 RepID=X7YN95_MYCXE|nr:hypothetical protein I553_9738 [Mycobacterium xenopi 4042]
MSARRRREILDALRRGTVPSNGLDQLAVGLGRFEAELDASLDAVAAGARCSRRCAANTARVRRFSRGGWRTGR